MAPISVKALVGFWILACVYSMVVVIPRYHKLAVCLDEKTAYLCIVYEAGIRIFYLSFLFLLLGGSRFARIFLIYVTVGGGIFLAMDILGAPEDFNPYDTSISNGLMNSITFITLIISGFYYFKYISGLVVQTNAEYLIFQKDACICLS